MEPESNEGIELDELIDAIASATTCGECMSSTRSYVAWVMGIKAHITECNHCTWLTASDWFKK